MTNRTAFFVSDLHGRQERYKTLFRLIGEERPGAVFLGGDLFSHAHARGFEDGADFIKGFLRSNFKKLHGQLGSDYPNVFAILGNDDGRLHEKSFDLVGREDELWTYLHGQEGEWAGRSVFGYAYVPPTPFHLKDWERYDVSRFVDPGCVSPEAGYRTVAVSADEIRFTTIANDLEQLSRDRLIDNSIWLFHSPPYKGLLDRAALDGQKVDHAPLDVHVGSVAVRRFIEDRQPAITLHGHVHESTRLTGSWHECMGRTHAFSAAHDGGELALVRFDPERPDEATRELV
jgi:Icc-related predicted phosphoesterase